MTRLSLPVHSYSLRSKSASPARLVNCFAEPLPPDAKSPALLTRAPGVASWTTVGTGPIYGTHSALTALFVVSGTELWRVTADKTATLLGSVGAAANIDMDSNTSAVVVVSEPRGYYWNGTFGEITDDDFTSRGAGDVEFCDNFLLFREPNSGRFFGADLGSAVDFDSLNFATAEASPDNLVGMKVDHRQALQFGAKSVEFWENTGAAGFPFERSINGFVEQGCANGRTVAKIDNTVLWLADDLTVRSLSGITPVRVSTHAIEQKLALCTITSARGESHTQGGHLFYVLSFDEGTFVYDLTTQLWHERQTYGSERWDWGSPVSFAGRLLVGSTNSNVIGEMAETIYSDLGATQRMEWTYQPIFAEQQRAFHDRLEMVFEPGVGLIDGQGVDPKVMLEYSDDGAKTWKALPVRSLGRMGKFEQRVVWHALGSARQRVYRGSISDPVSVTLTDTFAEVRGGRL